MNILAPKTVGELLGMNFYIPNYQRGYRWTSQQVEDLLNDINEFKTTNQVGAYCLQPLVVKSRDEDVFKKIKEASDLDEVKSLLKGTWEVIDGQQRLTTLYFILACLNERNCFSIDYQSREGSKSFLTTISESTDEILEKIQARKENDNIDFYHMAETQRVINYWFEKKGVSKEDYRKTLVERVEFIWYESTEADPIKVFTRLNIGKIALTNSELIKALFLRRMNFIEKDYHRIRHQQKEIGSEWDSIENTLQNDEFWLFLNEENYDKPTRIDFIFDLISRQDALGLKLNDEQIKDIGTDEYKTFRYFNTYLKSGQEITGCWKVVKRYFQTFQQWFNDLELYHYVGYLVIHGEKIAEIYKAWNVTGATKDYFLHTFIKSNIKKHLFGCIDLDKVYENEMRKCRPILLLHNIQSVINQNKKLIRKDKYRLPVFYKFPFHLYKKEEWDVEHIDSYTENTLEKENDRKQWLKASLVGITETENELIEEVRNYLCEDHKDSLAFDKIHKKIVGTMITQNDYQVVDLKNTRSVVKLADVDKDKLWNFALLDAGTNRGYGNSIFPAKRRVIIGKDQGRLIYTDENNEVVEKDGVIAFIPPCTKNVFLKYYNPLTNNLREWSKEDAILYLKNIKETLADFLNN